MIDLRLGDCLDILPTLDAHSVDAIITDLPYGTTACKWDVVIPFAPMWEQVKRILKPRGAFVTTASQPFTSLLVCSNLEWFKYEWIWEKDRPTGGQFKDIRPIKAHENILVFSCNHTTYNPQMTYGHKPTNQSGKGTKPPSVYGILKTGIGGSTTRYPRTIQRFNMPNHGEMGLHPTQKPVALYEYLIRTYTNRSDAVLDFCMGSGTTGVACVQLGRSFIGCELDPDYFAIAQKRIAAATPTEIELPLFSEVTV